MNSDDYTIDNSQSVRLTDLIEIGKSYFFHALRKWWVLLIFVLLSAGYFFYKSSITPDTYTAKLTFVLVESSNSGGGGFANILNQFGLSNSNKGVNMNRILDLLSSREIVGRSLFTKAEFQGKTDFLINHYIYIFKLHDMWKEGPNEALYDFYFENDSIRAFSYLENSVFKGLQGRISQSHIFHDVTDGDMFVIRVNSPSEFISYELANALFNVLSDYYVEKAVEKHQETFDIVKSRTDSFKTVLMSAESRLAKFQDSNRSIFKQESLLKEDRLIREVTLANSLYLESARNLESVRMNLLSSKPIIQPVDLPIYPLTSKFQKPLREIIKGGFLGGILGLIILFGFKFLSDLLANERREAEMKEEMV